MQMMITNFKFHNSIFIISLRKKESESFGIKTLRLFKQELVGVTFVCCNGFAMCSIRFEVSLMTIIMVRRVTSCHKLGPTWTVTGRC
jgi:hypothetical protein